MSDLGASLKSALADRYRIERELGAGGMAIVYLARDLKHDRRVAIKVLRPEVAAVIGPERFLREIKTIANLSHPHILGLIDSGVTAIEGQGSRVEHNPSTLDSRPSTFVYYVMPFVEGESLRDRLTREKQLPIPDAVRIASEVAAALDYAHRHGVIHRDIKPENIMLHDGSALVADFGIALALSSASATRMTETGMSLGTPHYMSPEQAMGEREITARSDVYSLACVTYEMLLGEPPFGGPTAQAIFARLMTEKPGPISLRRSTVSTAIEKAINTGLEKLPADRFGSTAELGAALRQGETSPPPSHPTGQRLLAEGRFRLSEDTCRRLNRASFDPRLIGTELGYLDNGVGSELLVCYIPACGLGGQQYSRVLETATYRAVAPTLRGFEPVTPWRPRLSLEDHIVLVREFLRDAVTRLKPRFTVIAGFSSGGDFALRFAAAPDPERRLPIDGCLSLGCNLSINTCFLTGALATLTSPDDDALLSILRGMGNEASSLEEWVDVCDYVVRIVPTFRHDVGPLQAFAAGISAPFEGAALKPFAEWYRESAAKGCRLHCVFEDTPMYRELVRDLQLRNLDEGLLGPDYREGSLITEAGTRHFDLMDPARIEQHVQALLVDMSSRKN